MRRTRFDVIILPATALSMAMSVPQVSMAQQCSGVRGGRAAVIAGAYVAGEGAALALRGSDWWAATPARSFHFVTGGSASSQQDALLHGAIGYQVSQLAALAWAWACVSPATSAWLGALTGFAIGLPKEVGDGFHNGFSLDDLGATAIGAALPARHSTVPASRVVTLKVFYWPSGEYRNRLPGSLPRLENDYAGQRYFLSINPARNSPAGAWPGWLGIGLGHSVSTWASSPPVDEWYVTLDIDLRGLPVRAEWWRTFASLADQLHFPSPGVRVSGGSLEFGFY